ncbi:radical SAM protein [Candidatus Bathycorpusculum sp.]|uniref:radical SAM protein n=1 Tax=Candidatus Bathycorpusculum sp. TaxID=2994959 RepID=UPI002818779F|nr:radical SAM protein [Candidatus Termitimicrobium sp.]
MTSGLRKAASLAGRYLSAGKPHHAQWLITRKCNYRCVGCNVWKEQDEHELSATEIKKGLDILRDIGIVELTISGGDPLLRPDIAEILDYASERFITTVYDNGSMAAKRVETLRKVDFVAISIDSLDEAKNDAIKAVPGAWKSAMHTVEVLQKEGIRVAVTPTISQKNLYEIMDLTTYFTEKKIPMWFCLYSYDTSVDSKQLFRIGKANDEFIITDKEAMVNLCNQLIKALKKNKNILMTKKLLETLRRLYETNAERTWKCQALNQFIVIDHLGRISGCHNHNFTGTVFDLPTQWNSKEFQTLRKTYHDCIQCNYLCYIAYSLYGSPKSIISLASDQWKNIKLILK